MSEGVIKEGPGTLDKIYRFRGSGNSKIHQSKSWYHLGSLQTSKTDFSTKIVFGFKPLTFFVKKLQRKSFSGSIKRFQQTLFMFWILKKACNIYTPMLEFTFPGEDIID